MKRSPTHVALPIWGRILMLLGMVFAVGLTMLGVGGAIWERDLTVLALVVGIMVPMSLGWLVILRRGMCRVTVTDREVVVRNLIFKRTVPLEQLTGATHRGSLALEFRDGPVARTIRIRMLMRDHQTQILEDIEARSDVLQAARVVARAAGVPTELRPQADVIWTNLIFGTVLIGMMGLMAAAGAYETLSSALEGAWSNAALGLFMGSVGGAFALLFLWMLTTRFIWRWEFTETHVRARRAIGWQTLPVTELESMTLRSETRLTKGVERTAWVLDFQFTGDRSLLVQPTENGLPARFSPADDHRILAELEQRLRPAYFPKSASAPKVRAAPTSASSGLAPLDALLAMPTGTRYAEGETIRDELVALPVAATPALVAAARRHLAENTPGVADVLVLALTDRGHPSAWPVYVEALDHAEEYVRFTAACGLDLAAGERFRLVEQCIQGGHIDHAAVDARIPALKKWWRQEGASAQAAAEAAYTPPRRASPREQRWNFIALNPTWVMEAGGSVHRPTPGTALPRLPAGVHVVGGTVRAAGAVETSEAVFELDARSGDIVAVFVRGDNGWGEVPRPWTEAKPRFSV